MLNLQLKNRRAETVIEVVVALFVVGIGLTVTAMLTHRMFGVMTHGRMLIQAKYLAIEGAEAVKNVVATNRIRFGDGCPATFETTPVCDVQSPQMGLSGGTRFSTSFNSTDFRWIMNPHPTPLEDADVRLRLPNPYSLYEHTYSGYMNHPLYAAYAPNSPLSPFYRMVEVAQSADSESLNVTVTVKWAERSTVHTYVLEDSVGL